MINLLKDLEKKLDKILTPKHIEYLLENKSSVDIDSFIKIYNGATNYIKNNYDVQDLPSYYGIVQKLIFIFEILKMDNMRILLLNDSNLLLQGILKESP